MSKSKNSNNGFTSGFVMVDCRANSSHPIFKGDGIALAIFYELAARMAYKPTTDNLGMTDNRVPLKPTQVLTSYRTLEKALGFPKHLIETRIKKLVDGVPSVCKGIIGKVPCRKMKGLSRNDGMVITILGGAKFGNQPDTAEDTKSDDVKSSSNKTEAEGFALPSDLDTPEVQEAWDNFKVHRKQRDSKRKGMTERSSKMVLNKLMELSKAIPDEAVTLINTAIECNWATVWPKKEELAIKAVKGSGNPNANKPGLLEHDIAATA